MVLAVRSIRLFCKLLLPHGVMPGGITNPYDVAQLWTNRDFTGNVVGVSPVATLCTNNRYSLVQDYSPNFNSLRALSAHELGHCFGASHDPSNSFFLMQPTILPTLTEFS